MSRFPFFKEIEGARILIVGGGSIAARRAQTLQQFNPILRAVAPEFCEAFEKLGIECICRRFEPKDLEGMYAVVAATNDREVNAKIAELGRVRGLEVNVSDDLDACTFLFPAVIRRGGMTVAMTSGGASPVATKYIRECIERVIPDNFEEVLARMEIARGFAKKYIPDSQTRAEALREAFNRCMTSAALPDSGALECMIRRYRCTEMD